MSNLRPFKKKWSVYQPTTDEEVIERRRQKVQEQNKRYHQSMDEIMEKANKNKNRET